MKLFRFLGLLIAYASVLTPIQMVLVHFGEPRAVWFWCDMAGLCH